MLHDGLEWNVDSTAVHAECEHHVGILEQAGVAEYDGNRRVVSQGPEFERIVPLVQAVSTVEEEHDFEKV